MIATPERSLLGQKTGWVDPDTGGNAVIHHRVCEYLCRVETADRLKVALFGADPADATFIRERVTHQYPCTAQEAGATALCFADVGLRYAHGKEHPLLLVEVVIGEPVIENLCRRLNLQRAAEPAAKLLVVTLEGLTQGTVEALRQNGVEVLKLGDDWQWWSETQRPNQRPQAVAELATL